MTFDDLLEIKIFNARIISVSSRVKGYFISSPSNFHTIVTKKDYSTIFYLIFYAITFDDLAKVKQDHSQMGSISSLNHKCMTSNSWKFHAFFIICTIVAFF